jgi:predicted metal-binding membrane protein
MIAFWIAVVVGVVVAVAYIGLAVQAFLRVRSEVLAAGTTGAADDLDPDEIDHDGVFTWKAFAAVVISTTVIVLLGVDSVFWYLPAALAIGSSIAVITAFVIDQRSAAKQGNR